MNALFCWKESALFAAISDVIETKRLNRSSVLIYRSIELAIATKKVSSVFFAFI
jgi:hypothetical protein